MRTWIVTTSLILTAIVGVALFAQDKAAPPDSSGHKLMSLAKNAEWSVLNAGLANGVAVDTTGYSEARFVISARGPIDKGTHASIGKNVKRYFDFYATMTSGTVGQVSRFQENGSPEGKIFEVVTVKTYGGKLQLVIRLSELETTKVLVDVDVYLIK